MKRLFPFAQFEFPFLLGPADGRYVTRGHAGGAPERVIVLRTLGAPQRRLLRRRRPSAVARAEASPVPISRATLVRPSPFESSAAADQWLSHLRGDRTATQSLIDSEGRILNEVLHAYRLSAVDPYAGAVSPASPLAVRLGYGEGEEVADGRFSAAFELPAYEPRAARRRVEAPEERMTAILGLRDRPLVAEELVLRARADLDAGRAREAALQCRIALESLLSEPALPEVDLETRRAAVGRAANAALGGEPEPDLQAAVVATVAEMETALRRRRAGT